jgi:hypothetical protein
MVVEAVELNGTILGKEAIHKTRLRIRTVIPKNIRRRTLVPACALLDGRFLDTVPIRNARRPILHKEIPSDILCK